MHILGDAEPAVTGETFVSVLQEFRLKYPNWCSPKKNFHHYYDKFRKAWPECTLAMTKLNLVPNHVLVKAEKPAGARTPTKAGGTVQQSPSSAKGHTEQDILTGNIVYSVLSAAGKSMSTCGLEGIADEAKASKFFDDFMIHLEEAYSG